MPLLDASKKWSKKAARIMAFILETGNFGHKRDNSFRQKSFLVRSAVSSWCYSCDIFCHPDRFAESLGKDGVDGVRGRG